MTDKQAKAMELIKNGVVPTRAMKEAGYSEQTSKAPTRNLLSLPGVQNIIEQYKASYFKVGITPDYMVKKTAEWLEAKKVLTSMTEPDREVPDYQTQTKAAEMVRSDWGMGKNEINFNQVNIGGDMGIKFTKREE